MKTNFFFLPNRITRKFDTRFIVNVIFNGEKENKFEDYKICYNRQVYIFDENRKYTTTTTSLRIVFHRVRTYVNLIHLDFPSTTVAAHPRCAKYIRIFSL